jgi:hypothetical protein
MLDVPLPPPSYGIYHGPLQVLVETLSQVEYDCHTRFGHAVNVGDLALGCQWWNGTLCVIVIPVIADPVTPELARRVTLHELGHCSGWPADHPRY